MTIINPENDVNPRVFYLTALKFLNALHHKNDAELRACFSPHGTFQDVLPDGTVVRSVEELMKLHVGFMQNKITAFRPFDWQSLKSTHRDFEITDLEKCISFENGCFCRVAAEVNRPVDFKVLESPIKRYYMHLGVLAKGHYVVHVQNTLFDPTNTLGG